MYSLNGNGFMQGWMKCTKLLSMPSTGFLGSMKRTKLVMNEMYEIYLEIAQIAA